jgi:hypothetical protein
VVERWAESARCFRISRLGDGQARRSPVLNGQSSLGAQCSVLSFRLFFLGITRCSHDRFLSVSETGDQPHKPGAQHRKCRCTLRRYNMHVSRSDHWPPTLSLNFPLLEPQFGGWEVALSLSFYTQLVHVACMRLHASFPADMLALQCQRLATKAVSHLVAITALLVIGSSARSYKRQGSPSKEALLP